MNRKEIAEIRKLLCMQKNPIHTIYGCYVNSEKDLLSESASGNLPFQRMNFSNIWTSSEKLFPERRKKI